MLNDNFFEVEEHSNASKIIDAEDSITVWTFFDTNQFGNYVCKRCN
ncbi:11449_t:CDS:2, partial [Entrophospora sp. SA101]